MKSLKGKLQNYQGSIECVDEVLNTEKESEIETRSPEELINTIFSFSAAKKGGKKESGVSSFLEMFLPPKSATKKEEPVKEEPKKEEPKPESNQSSLPIPFLFPMLGGKKE